ncbi:MAG: glutathione synthetase [Thermodesulfobacteriota bacterium]|nr:MAG: glutathione synthetase [Thermodesulfobacteriota bacterium]
MNLINFLEAYIGYVGMILINICYLPQLIKTIKTKDVSSISLSRYLLLTSGLVCYLIYSLIRKDMVYNISNIVSTLQSLLMIFLILKYRN